MVAGHFRLRSPSQARTRSSGQQLRIRSEGAARVVAVEVEAGGVGVDLQRRPGFSGGGEDAVPVEVPGVALLYEAAAGVGDDVDVRVAEDTDEAVGQFLARLTETDVG